MYTFIDKVVAEFGEKIGIKELSFDKDGMCFMVVDEELPLVFRNDIDNDVLILISELSHPLPENPSPGLIKTIMSAALNPLKKDEPGIGLNSETGTLLAYWNIATKRVNVESLKQFVGQFIEFQKAFVSRLQEQS